MGLLLALQALYLASEAGVIPAELAVEREGCAALALALVEPGQGGAQGHRARGVAQGLAVGLLRRLQAILALQRLGLQGGGLPGAPAGGAGAPRGLERPRRVFLDEERAGAEPELGVPGPARGPRLE